MTWESYHDNLETARKLDAAEPLRSFRDEFVFPYNARGEKALYFAGHSLGLMPVKAKAFVDEELDAWARLGVAGHLQGKHPWLPYHENLTASLARLVGAKPTEVVAMNSLTVNLHLMLVSFYRPTRERFKILIENNTFPSDKYAVDSQARLHGLDPSQAVVELKPRAGELTVRPEDLVGQIDALGESLSLVLLGNCNYLTGQCFDFTQVVGAGHRMGAMVGFNLAHGAGNLALGLHASSADFAVWCSYKYLNAGPGGIAGAFVHERHLNRPDIARFEGWWGHDKASRFKMGPAFKPLPTVEAWQLSNPPIFQLASLRASMELFDRATVEALREKGDKLTSYFEWLLKKHLGDKVEILTPALPARGSMLCFRLQGGTHAKVQKLERHGVFVDFREPNILRATPAPLYNSYEDVFRFVKALEESEDV